MDRRRPVRAAVGLAVLVGTLAGPAVPAPAGAAEATSQAKTEYLAKGNAVCQTAARRLAERVTAFESRKQGGSRGTRKVATPRDVARYLNEVALDEVARQIRELAALRPPGEDAADVKKMLDTARAALTQVRRNPADAAFDDPFGPVARQLGAYGLTACGTGDLDKRSGTATP